MKDSSSLTQEIEAAKEQIQIGSYYLHYKRPDKVYQIINLAFLESNEEVCVVYQALYPPYLTWIRPLSNFLETVSTDQGKQKRFTKLTTL